MSAPSEQAALASIRAAARELRLPNREWLYGKLTARRRGWVSATGYTSTAEITRLNSPDSLGGYKPTCSRAVSYSSAANLSSFPSASALW
jgi:hypothetical protein